MAEVTPPRPPAGNDERGTFDCGRDSLNAWFWRHAWHNQGAGVSRVNIVCDASTGLIVGYVTLSAAQIEREFLPKAQRRNRPIPLPATLLGQLAVHKDYHGQGHGRSLLLFALRTALRASRDVASFGVITHPLDDDLRAYYRRWGFEDLPFDPQRAMIVRMIDLEKGGIGGS